MADSLWLSTCEAHWALRHLEELPGPFHSSQAELRCAAAALGIERYRLATGEWPESLDQLGIYAPKQLTDPYDGKPLRLRKWTDGVVVYSVGPDREDNGGNLVGRNDSRTPKSLQGKDIGFRLWDPEKRGQTPVEEKK